MRGLRARRMLGLLAVPAAIAALVLGAAQGVPVRFDLRTLQSQARLADLGLPRGVDLLVCTADNSVASAELALFAVRYWAFPRGRLVWLVPAETSGGEWVGGFFTVDAAGGFGTLPGPSRDRAAVAATAPAPIAPLVDRAAVVYDSAATRAVFEARLPELRTRAPVFVAPGAGALHPFVSVDVSWSWTRWLRLAAVIGVLLLGLVSGWRLASDEPALGLLGAATGLALGAGALLGCAYIVGQAWPSHGFLAAPLLWLGASCVLARVDSPPCVWRRSWPARFASALALATAMYAALLVARLDFDGDTYTTYLPAARYYALLGRHVPADPGVAALVQGAVYPPGLPVLLALPAWIVGQESRAAYTLSPETSLSILLYRLLAAALLVGSLVGLGCLGAALRGGSWHLGLAASLAALACVPALRGQHTGAETLLLPLVASGLAAIVAGGRRQYPILAGAGVCLCALGTLAKLEGLPFLLALALPAAWAAGALRGTCRRWSLAGLVLGLLPWAVWQLSGPAANPAFQRPETLVDAASRLPAIGALAFKALVRHELWLPLFAGLPVAVLLRRACRRPLVEYAPPAGIVAICSAWLGVYALSTLGFAGHLETSYARITLGPAVAALVYCVESLSFAGERRDAPRVETADGGGALP